MQRDKATLDLSGQEPARSRRGAARAPRARPCSSRCAPAQAADPGRARARADRRRRRRRGPDRRHPLGARCAARCRVAGAGLRPAVPVGCGHRASAAPSATRRAAPPHTAARTTACRSRCARSGNRAPRRGSRPFQGDGSDCPRKFLIGAAARPHRSRRSARRSTTSTPRRSTRPRGARSPPAADRHADQDPVLRADARAGRPLRGNRRTAAAHTGAICTRSSRRATRSRCRREQLKVAVNGEFADWWTRRCATGDAVVFIPPVAGG